MTVNSDLTPIALDRFAPYQISVLAEGLARRMSVIVREAGGLSLTQWRVLAAVAEQPGRSANEIVAVTPMDKAIVSRAVKRLLDMALIVRRASRSDGRLSHIHLTAKGRRIYERLADQARGLERDLFSALSADERDAAADLLARLSASVAKMPA